jgi:hypothetical protein
MGSESRHKGLIMSGQVKARQQGLTTVMGCDTTSGTSGKSGLSGG